MADFTPATTPWPQVLIAYEAGEEIVVYAAAYCDYDCGEAIEDCRAKHGNAKLLLDKESA
jgi:hypothetical protein